MQAHLRQSLNDVLVYIQNNICGLGSFLKPIFNSSIVNQASDMYCCKIFSL